MYAREGENELCSFTNVLHCIVKWGETHLRVVFVSHPFALDPDGNRRRVAAIARRLVLEKQLPLAPQIYLPVFLDEATERELALRLCLRCVALSDEVRSYGEPTAGMRLEIAEARRLGIPVVEGKYP